MAIVASLTGDFERASEEKIKGPIGYNVRVLCSQSSDQGDIRILNEKRAVFVKLRLYSGETTG